MRSYFLGICSASARIGAPTAIAMLEIQRAVHQRGERMGYAILSQADVATARNTLAATFLASGADVFVGLDDDTAISAEVFATIASASHPCVSVIVPRRDLDLAAFAARIRAGDGEREALLGAAPPLGLPRGGTPGFFPVERGRTGAYFATRTVFERLADERLTRRQPAPRPQGGGRGAGNYEWGFFDPGHDEEGRYMSEDYAFFHRVRRSGIPIMAWYGPGVTHSGMATYAS